MWNIIAIALGGAAGALARYALGGAIQRATAGWTVFPWGTLTINLSGCFIIGFLAAVFDAFTVSPVIRNLLTIGFLGAFTTFSTFGLETFRLLADRELGLAFLNLAGSVVTGLALVYAGVFAGRWAATLLK